MMEIIYSSITGNTKKLAETIKESLNENVYCGSLKEVLADTVFIGFWTTKNSCADDVKKVLESLNNKKVFLFGTCGYNNTPEFFNNILNNVKENINDSNTIIGEFMSQGAVSANKRKALEGSHPDYLNMIPKLDESLNHPNEDDLNKLRAIVKSL
ncbi:MAG: flavodoxin family protein [bacterium]